MKGNRKQRVMIGVAVMAVIAGAIVAIVTATGGSHTHRRSARAGAGASELAVAASYVGLTRAQLRSDLQAGKTLAEVASATRGRSASGLIEALVKAKAARLDTALAHGKLSKARSATLAELRKRATVEVNRPRRAVGVGGDLSATASYLGVTPTQLRRERRPVRSLAQIANATPGKSAAGLIEMLVRERKAELAAAAAAGSLSQASENRLLSTLRQRVTAEVDR